MEEVKGSIGRNQTCASCGLYSKVLNPRMKPFGKFKKGILNVGEAPGEVEDRRGKQWQGRAGRLLRRTYKRLGIDLFRDCLNINAVNCRPKNKNGNNRAPTDKEIACCRKRVLEVIEQYKPKVIIVLGNAAITSLLGHRWKKDLDGITKWRGWTIPDRDFEAWLCPTYHPSFVMRGDEKEEVMTIWERDLKQAFSMIDKPLPNFEDDTQKIEITDDLSFIEYLPPLISFDYETTGLKPYDKGHRIVCASIGIYDYAYVFMMPRSRSKRAPFLNLLKNPRIGKTAHNIKFEDTWSIVRLKQKVNSWKWDSEIAAHIFDNRAGITSLKFQTYIHFGIVDYASEIEPYLKSGSKSGNTKNRVLELVESREGREKLMIYCGLDSLYQFKLATKQMASILETREGVKVDHFL